MYYNVCVLCDDDDDNNDYYYYTNNNGDERFIPAFKNRKN